MLVKSVRLIFIALLLLSFSISIRCFNMAHISTYNNSNSASLIGLVPQRLRLVLAGILWEKADEYMHLGPSLREKTNYTAGSFAGNTELVALLSLSIELAPHQPHAYSVLTQNLAKYLGLFTEGIRILQFGIQNNSKAIWLHELYAEAAFQYLFDVKTTLKTILASQKYIDKAIKIYPVDKNYEARQEIYSLKNYLMFKSRITEKINKLNGKTMAKDKVSETHLTVENNLNKIKTNPTFEKKVNLNHDHHKHHEHKHIHNHSHNKVNARVPLKMRLIYSFLLFLLLIVFMLKIYGFKKSI